VTNGEDVQQVVDRTIDRVGRIDVLVNNAGNAWFDHTVNSTDDDWKACFDVNLFSAVRFTRAVVPQMRKQGGSRIINMSSDPEAEFVADGMTEDLITSLSNTFDMFVIARDSELQL
jgi:NAD(P)-dependent dehydrogenase (short-subunit alcohol dehydrogenase family)